MGKRTVWSPEVGDEVRAAAEGLALLRHRAAGRGQPYYGPVASSGYLRFPHVTNDLMVFVAADDVWLAPVAGGRAWRFTTDEAQAATPRLTPDGSYVAWV